MGSVTVDIVLKGRKGEALLKDVLVDTGATHTILGKGPLERVGAYYSRGTWVTLGDKRTVKAEEYSAIVSIGDRECTTSILTFKNAEQVIGVLTLEALGLRADPTTGKLEPTRETSVAHFF